MLKQYSELRNVCLMFDVDFFFRGTKFNITSPLNFIMSNIKQPTDTPNEFEVTVSLGSVTKDRIGTHELCFVAESTNG